MKFVSLFCLSFLMCGFITAKTANLLEDNANDKVLKKYEQYIESKITKYAKAGRDCAAVCIINHEDINSLKESLKIKGYTTEYIEHNNNCNVNMTEWESSNLYICWR